MSERFFLVRYSRNEDAPVHAASEKQKILRQPSGVLLVEGRGVCSNRPKRGIALLVAVAMGDKILRPGTAMKVQGHVVFETDQADPGLCARCRTILKGNQNEPRRGSRLLDLRSPWWGW